MIPRRSLNIDRSAIRERRIVQGWPGSSRQRPSTSSARYRITKNFQIFGEWVNINNAKYVAYQNGPGARDLLQPTARAIVRRWYQRDFELLGYPD